MMSIVIYKVKTNTKITFLVFLLISIICIYPVQNKNRITLLIDFLALLFLFICFISSMLYYVKTDDDGMEVGFKYFLPKRNIKWEDVKSFKYVEYGKIKIIKINNNSTYFIINFSLIEEQMKFIEIIEEKAVDLKEVDRVKFRYIKKEL